MREKSSLKFYVIRVVYACTVTFNSQRHPPSISLDRSSEGQTTPLQLHGQLRRRVIPVCKHVVAKAFIRLAECQDYACGLEKCGVNNEVSLFTKIYTEPKHIPCLAVGKDKGFYPKRMWFPPNILMKAGMTLERERSLPCRLLHTFLA